MAIKIRDLFKKPDAEKARQQKSTGGVKPESKPKRTKGQQEIAAQLRFNNVVGPQKANEVATKSNKPAKLSNPTGAQLDLVMRNEVPNPAQHNYKRPNQSFSGWNKLMRTFSGGGQYGLSNHAVEDIYEEQRPKTAIEQARNDATHDTTSDSATYYMTGKFGYTADQKKEIIEWGQNLMGDEESIVNWIASGATYEEKVNRQKQVEDWFKNKSNISGAYVRNPEENKLELVDQVTDKAALPPWLERNADNLYKWDYYKVYGSEVNKLNVKASQEAQVAANKRERQNYASAFSTDEDSNAVNSYADIIIKSKDYKSFIKNTDEYLTRYVYNPIRHGHLLTAAGNGLYNLMETMDIAARGVRAFVAGDTVLGGSGGTWEKEEYDFGDGSYEDYMTGPEGVKYTSGRNPDAKFKGQKVYWATLEGKSVAESKEAQRRFMDNGGYALMMKMNPNMASKQMMGSEEFNMSEEALEKKLDLAFAGSDIDWREIRDDLSANYFTKDRAVADLGQALKNVRSAYTRPDAGFEADTGSLAGDIVLETILDPGTMAGGLSRGVVKGGVSNVAEDAVAKGFQAVVRNADEADVMFRNKEVRLALNELINHNNGKSIVFKKSDDVLAEVNNFMDRVAAQTGMLDNLTDRFAFRRQVYGQIMEKQKVMNSSIIAAQDFSKRALDRKAMKAAYMLDKSIDVVDSAIVKSSFFVPWAGVKGAKLGFNTAMDSSIARKIMAKRTLDKANAINTLASKKTGKINVLRVQDVYDKHVAGVIDRESMRFALDTVKGQYDDVAKKVDNLITEFNSGKVSDVQAKASVDSFIKDITGDEMSSVEDMRAYIDNLDGRYTGELKNAFDRLDNAYQRLDTAINRTADDLADTMLDKQLTDAALEAGIKGIGEHSKGTVVRKVTFDKFMKALRNSGLEEFAVPDSARFDRTATKLYDKLEGFVKEWSKDKYVVYNTQDMLKEIDRMQRSAEVSNLMKWETPSEAAGISTYKITAQFSALRREIKKIDTISLKDVSAVIIPQTDRMALQMDYRNRPEVQKMYGEFVEKVIDPILAEAKSSSEGLDLMEQDIYPTLQLLKEMQYGFNRTNNLIDDAKNLRGFNEQKLHVFINQIANNFGYKGDLQDLLAYPDLLRRQLEKTLRAQTGDSKFGIKGMTNDLRGLLSGNASDALKPYADEIEANPQLRTKLESIVNKDVLDPTSYVEVQMLYTAMMDPTSVYKWNTLAAQGNTPIFWHTQTTGLNTEINEIASISARKWTPIDVAEGEKVTLEQLLEAFNPDDTIVFQRHMTDKEIESISENVLRRMDIKGATLSQLRDKYKSVYGLAGGSAKSEEDVLREACEFLTQNSVGVDESGAAIRQLPALIIHDLDGFNLPYFNSRTQLFREQLGTADPIANYVDNLAYDMRHHTLNTYDNLSKQMGDFAYSEAELEQLTDLVKAYAESMNVYGQHYQFMDMATYSRELDRLNKSIGTKIEAGKATDTEKKFYDLWKTADGDSMLSDYTRAVHEVEQLTLKPRGYAFTQTGLEINPVHAARQMTGQDTINVQSRIYVDDVLSYFDLDVEDGFLVPVEDLRKMHDLSEHIIRKRDREIVSGAEEYLAKFKPQFEQMINMMKNTARNDRWQSSELAYIADLKIPNTSVETYLMARKLYNDHMRFWLDGELTSGFRKQGRDLDKLKIELQSIKAKKGVNSPATALAREETFASVIDYYTNYRRRFVDELVGGGFNAAEARDVFSLLSEQELRTKAYYEEVSSTYQNVLGELKELGAGSDSSIVKDAEMHLESALDELDRLRSKAPRDFEQQVDELNNIIIKESDDALSLLEGADSPRIFKKAAKSDYEKRIMKYENGVLKEGIDASRKCSEARSEMESSLRQLEDISKWADNHGGMRPDQRLLGATHRKAALLFDILHETSIAKRPSFQTFIEKASELRQLQLQQYRLNAIKVNGEFNKKALYTDMLYNGFNMTVFNSAVYDRAEMDALKKAVADWGDDFVSVYDDKRTGNIFIYFNNNATITEGNNMRFINNLEGFEKPLVKDHVPFAEFDELLDVIKDIDDIEDFRGVYNHLLSCWDDTRMLSFGKINGSSGRVVNRRQAEEFLQSLPDEMSDWCTSEGLLRSDLMHDAVYDPGFVRNEPADILFDFMDTLNRQAAVAKEDTMLISSIINKNDNLMFNDLVEQFTDEELMSYFGENSNFVVCAVLPKETTATGFEIRQLKLSNKASLDMAKSYEHVTVMPYDAYYEMANTINRVPMDDNVYRRMLSKYMLVYKAFALIKPGTWMRNFIDATTKAAIDQGGGVSEMASMFDYEVKAVKGLDVYGRIMKTDPSLLNKGNWEMIQHVYHTDMTYEDFEILKGVVDGARFKSADKTFINRSLNARGGKNVISGENIGLRNLEEKDLNNALNKYLRDDEMTITKQQFKDAYYGLNTDPEIQEAFEYNMRVLSRNMRSANAGTWFDKSIDNMFKPFGTVEQVVRYAQTMYLRDKGLRNNEIMRRIHSTQFYNAPSWGAFNKLETIMPFVTYKYNNAMFWMRMFDENPRYFRIFEDIYGNIMDDTIESMQQQSQDIDYENDYALQSGGIPIGNGSVYFNIGNSFLSALNDFYGLPHDFNSLNPLLRDTVRLSLYSLGFDSNEFFSTVDLNPWGEDAFQKAVEAIPGGKLIQSGIKTFKDIAESTEDGGPTMDALISVAKYAGILGSRHMFAKSGSFDFEEWQADLEKQGLWYDCNKGMIVDLSEKNETGANAPYNTFEDIQAYQMLHFGKLWDANQGKFVALDDYQEGGLNDGFDFENHPESAWEALCYYMKMRKHKLWDYNVREFVPIAEYQEGGLNDPNIDFDTKAKLMEDKFGLYWDGNRKAWVEKDRVIAGGLNDTKSFSEVMSLRYALYGEVYNRATGHFEVVTEPKVVAISNLDEKRLENYYSRLGIPALQFVDEGLIVTNEGLLKTKDGRYVLTGDLDLDNRVFDKFKHTFGYFRRSRGYSNWKNYSYNKTWDGNRRHAKKYVGHPSPDVRYMTGYGWNDIDGYYRWNYSYNYQYHNPQPTRYMHRLAAPRIHYPYNAQYSKFAYQKR